MRFFVAIIYFSKVANFSTWLQVNMHVRNQRSGVWIYVIHKYFTQRIANIGEKEWNHFWMKTTRQRFKRRGSWWLCGCNTFGTQCALCAAFYESNKSIEALLFSFRFYVLLYFPTRGRGPPSNVFFNICKSKETFLCRLQSMQLSIYWMHSDRTTCSRDENDKPKRRRRNRLT